jgi:hypothetical protein
MAVENIHYPALREDIVTFKSEWEFVKKNFENATGKKKPSATFLGVVKKGSGIGGSCEKIDACLAKSDAKGLEKAVAELNKNVADYQKVLSAAVLKETDKNLAGDIKQMMGELIKLQKDAKTEFAKLDDDSKTIEVKRKAWKLIVENVIKTPLPGNAGLKAFIANKEFGQDLITKKDDPKLKKLQADAKAKLVAYIGGLNKVKACKTDQPGDKAQIKKFLDALHDANDFLNIDGVLGVLGQWRTAAAGGPAKVQAFGNSPLKAQMDAANDALSAENQRLGILEQQFERQVTRTR